MFEVVRVVDAAPRRDPAIWDFTVESSIAAAAACNPIRSLISTTSAGTINGGDLIVRLRFDDEALAHRATRALHEIATSSSAVERIHGADYETDNSPTPAADPVGPQSSVYRALLLRVPPDTDAALTERFENDLTSMPKHISSIVRWRLSPVSRAFGPTAWTHVWEQEFTGLDGLLGEYMNHPVHWGIVDRWFDPECPDMIVRDRVCHTFCALDEPILDAESNWLAQSLVPSRAERAVTPTR